MFLVSTRNFPPDIGGIQNLMEGLSIALLDHGPVKVFADSYKNSESYDQMSKLNIQRISGFKIFRKYRKANLVKDFINNNDVRSVFFDHWKSIENLHQTVLKKTKTFCLIHSKEINHPIGSLLNKRMLKSLNKSDYVIANSNFTKELIIKLGLEMKKVKVINPGCNYPIKIEDSAIKYAENIYKDAYPRLITISRLDGRKGHQNILMTIKNLLPRFPKLKYVSIGNGEEKDKLEILKKELGLEQEVSFVYEANEQQKVALLEKSDLFVMPSIIYKKSIEGFGITFIEAASYGKASIGGIFGGEADAIIEGETGYLCDGNNLSTLYETILKSFENEHYKKLGNNALIFSKKFSWEKIVKKYIELI
jgi:phosphatidyl-myo-inositol dimannoside synthase